MTDDSARATDTPVQNFRKAETLVRNQPRNALRELEPVLHDQPDKPSVQLLAARAYYHSAQLHRAESALNKVVQLDPTDHYARFVLGRTLQRLGRPAEALTQIRMAAAMNPVPEYQEARGEISARLTLD